MGFKKIPTEAAGVKFFNNPSLLRELAAFEAEVKREPEKFSVGVLQRFHRQFVIYGVQQLQAMSRILQARDFPTGSLPREIGGLLNANLDRYTALWQRNVDNAFATALDSALPGRRSIVSRIIDFFTGETEKFQAPKKIKKQGFTGIARTSLVNGKRRIFRQSLSKYLKLLFRTYPMNFQRDHNMVVSRWKSKGGEGEDVFFINSGKSSNSSPVCVLCQGRALTRSALKLVTSQFQSPLFHPNAVLEGSTFVPYGELDEMVGADYEGPAVVLSAEGYSLTIGPNHPILTVRGLVRARDLNKGDQLVYDLRCEVDSTFARTPKSDLKQVPLVEDAFESVRLVSRTVCIPPTSDDLHGDGVFCKGDIEVVVPTGSLLSVLDSCSFEQFREDGFVGTDVEVILRSGVGSEDFSLDGVLHTPTGSVGSRLSSMFRLVHVDNISIVDFKGKAFDATTKTSLYNSNGFVVSNCRHRTLPTAAMTEFTYDDSHGKLVTVKTVEKWLASGKIKRAKRPRPAVVNV